MKIHCVHWHPSAQTKHTFVQFDSDTLTRPMLLKMWGHHKEINIWAFLSICLKLKGWSTLWKHTWSRSTPFPPKFLLLHSSTTTSEIIDITFARRGLWWLWCKLEPSLSSSTRLWNFQALNSHALCTLPHRFFELDGLLWGRWGRHFLWLGLRSWLWRRAWLFRTLLNLFCTKGKGSNTHAGSCHNVTIDMLSQHTMAGIGQSANQAQLSDRRTDLQNFSCAATLGISRFWGGLEGGDGAGFLAGFGAGVTVGVFTGFGAGDAAGFDCSYTSEQQWSAPSIHLKSLYRSFVKVSTSPVCWI